MSLCSWDTAQDTTGSFNSFLAEPIFPFILTVGIHPWPVQMQSDDNDNKLIHSVSPAISAFKGECYQQSGDLVLKNKQPVWIPYCAFTSGLLLLGCWTLLVSCSVVLCAQLQGLHPALPFVPSCHNSCSEKLKFLQVQANYRQPKNTDDSGKQESGWFFKLHGDAKARGADLVWINLYADCRKHYQI